MSCFATKTAATTAVEPDPTKHVNYTLGMVLGVDDFTQEFSYLAERDRWLARDLLGYGTARGLKISIDVDASSGARVMVAPGVAVSPRGQLICVSSAQCCYLNDWLKANAKEIPNRLNISSPIGSPLGSPLAGQSLTLYVTLSYRDCPTDDVPIPGEPCRSEDDLTAPSRLVDDFQLELSFNAPRQREEDAVRDFVAWLKQVNVTASLGASTPLRDFLDAIRAAAKPWLSPPSSPLEPADFMFGSPPVNLRIHPDDACEYLRAAFRLWTTELRPVWHGRGRCCGSGAMEKTETETRVLLAELNVPLVFVAPDWRVSDVLPVIVNERNRPYLLHLRMLQEWMLCGRIQTGTLTSPISSPPSSVAPHTHALDDLSDVNAPAPTDNQFLIRQGGIWVSATPTFSGLDLSGTYPSPNVIGLRGRPVSNAAPNTSDALVWNGTAWTPGRPTTTLPTILPLATITRTDNTAYEVWFNIDSFSGNAASNRAAVEALSADVLRIQAETAATPFLSDVNITTINPVQGSRNRFLVLTQGNFTFIRFNFDIARISVSVSGGPSQRLLEFANANGIGFKGFNGRNIVTIFVR